MASKDYEIRWAWGRVENFPTWDEVEARVLDEFPEAAIGHPGDLSDFGDRTLCWRTEEEALNDPGARAVCVIHEVKR